MKIYNYDTYGYFVSESDARPNPLEPGNYLIPAMATTIAPPAVPIDKAARFFGGEWIETYPLSALDIVNAHDIHLYKMENDLVVPRTQQEIDADEAAYPVNHFSFKILWGTIWAGALSPVGLIEMPAYQTVIESMWNFPNRSAIYPFCQSLVAAGKATAGDLAIVVAAFADQDIDITTIQ